MSNERNLEEIYKEIILDHFAHPRGCRDFENVSSVENGNNVSCGDKVEIKVQVDNGEIRNLSVCTSGCAICVSSGSIMYGLLKKYTVKEALVIIDEIVDFIKGDKELNSNLNTTAINSLAGIKKFPSRLKCALLPWKTALNVLIQEENSK